MAQNPADRVDTLNMTIEIMEVMQVMVVKRIGRAWIRI